MPWARTLAIKTCTLVLWCDCLLRMTITVGWSLKYPRTSYMLKSGVIFQNMTTYCMVLFCGRAMTITRMVNTTKDFFFSEPKCGLLLAGKSGTWPQSKWACFTCLNTRLKAKRLLSNGIWIKQFEMENNSRQACRHSAFEGACMDHIHLAAIRSFLNENIPN